MDKKLTSASNVQQVLPTKIKLCGYLKKKRNKVGGWRKMWFVLQDKLLLSYVSKEEYDNKLVSFKDVLNLVPGTVVRPLGGFRFTIETTSQAMYTFYCDDRAAYREWISMLLLSIASQSVVTPIAINSKSSNLASRFANISLDNIPVAVLSSQAPTALSNVPTSSSMTQTTVAATTALGVASARLPIAQKTAKMLERNGVNALDLNIASSEQELNKSCHTCWSYGQTEKSGSDGGGGIREFRLHEDVAVSNQPKYLNAEVAHSVTLINRMFSAAMMEKSNCAHQECSKVSQNTSTDKKKCGNASTTDDQAKDLNRRNFHTNERHHMELMQESLCRLTIKGTKEIYLEMNEDWIEKHNKKKLITKTSKEQLLIKKKLNSAENLAVTIVDNSQNAASKIVEPVYAVVDLKNKYAQRKIRNTVLETKRCNSYDSIIHNTYFPVQSKTNLYEKEEFIKSSCNNSDIEAIYEDGDLFPKEDTTNGYSKNEEENIYEPINVTSMHKNAFLSYLNRFKINSLLQLNRIRKKNTDCVTPKHDERYFDLRNKNSSTRKSIKVRMRKLCFREYEPKPFFKHSQQPVYGSAASAAPVKKLKTKWKSVKLGSENRNVLIDDIASNRSSNKRIFGSLPHLRKTRISIFSNKHFQMLPTKDETKGKTKIEPESSVIESAVELNIVTPTT